MKNIFALVVMSFPVTILMAQSPTWNQDIAPIVFEHCSSCHHQGGLAPFSLVNYTDAYQNINDIATDVGERKMPPWPPQPSYSHFVGERALTYQQVNAIEDWINAGAPEGTGTPPTPPSFNSVSMMSVIDTTIALPAYQIQGSIDEYRTFVVHSGLDSDKFINQIEFMVGNNAVVHHILIYQDPTNTSWNYDQNDPGPGYTSNGTTVASPYATLITGWAPGVPIEILPSNFGIKVPAGSDFVVEFHYAPGHQGEIDSSKINLHYCTSNVNVRQVVVSPVLYYQFPSLVNGPLFIPANSVNTFTERAKFTLDKSLISVGPHMHLIGTSIKSFFVDGAGDTTHLINIPRWDFHWQGFYTFQHIIKLPANTYLYAQATYDNTVNNPLNPNSPPIDVSAGEHTTDEMMLVFFAYTNYQPGDENIVFDTTSYTTGLPEVTTANEPEFNIIPNPSAAEFFIEPGQEINSDYSISISDVTGNVLLQKNLNRHNHLPIDISSLESGIYFLKITGADFTVVKRIVKSY